MGILFILGLLYLLTITKKLKMCVQSYNYINCVYCRCKPQNYNYLPMKLSFGIICIILDTMSVLMVENKPYPKPIKSKVQLNINELYNLQMSSFPNGTPTERQYTFPKGRLDNIDIGKRCELTKVREFIEETKYFSHELMGLARRHYTEREFISLLNDRDNQVYEEWIGLDNKRYATEYSIFIVDSIKSLQYKAQHKNNCISPKLISTLLPFRNASNRVLHYYEKKMTNVISNDSNTKTVLVDIITALKINNIDKKVIIERIDENKVSAAIKKALRIKNKIYKRINVFKSTKIGE